MFGIVPVTVLLWLSSQAEQPGKAAQLRHNSLPHAAALLTSHHQVKTIHRTWEETHRKRHRGLLQIYIGCEGILYYCFPAYCSSNINQGKKKKKTSPNTRYKNSLHWPFFGQGLAKVWREFGKGAPPHTTCYSSFGFPLAKAVCSPCNSCLGGHEEAKQDLCIVHVASW